MPAFELAAYGGAMARITLTMPTLAVTGETTTIGSASLAMPRFSLSASGDTEALASAELTVSSGYELSAYTGAVLAATLINRFTLSATSDAGAIMSAMLEMPQFTLTFEASVESFGTAELTMPMLVPVGSGQARMTMPPFRLNAVATAIVAATYEGYAVNLRAPLDSEAQRRDVYPEVTRYTGMPFNQIVRFDDNYYGVANDGLYLLGGDTDDGAAIAWAFDTCMTDFGSKQQKRAVSVYIGGRLEDQATLTVYPSEGVGTSESYAYTTPRGEGAQNYRQKVGKGIKARYYAFGLADTAGNYIEIDSMDFEAPILKRAI